MNQVTLDKRPDGIWIITLNAPDSLNAMSEQMAAEFSALTRSLISQHDGCRSLILTGAGRAFSAGGDLEMLERKTTLGAQENIRIMREFYGSFLGILDLNIPLIAALNGSAIGAGLCVASACDIRIAAEAAKLGFTFVKLGLHPGMGATYFLPRILGDAAARELILTGRVIDSTEALRIGLVSKVVAADQVLDEAIRIASEIGENGPLAVRQVVESLRILKPSLDQALQREAECQSINYSSPEFLEGIRAIKEKRKPSF